jgi:hypothetical protein
MATEHPVRMLEITDHLLKLARASVVDYEMTKLPFTLEPRKWFAMEYIFPNAQRHYSPVWIERVTAQKSGHGFLELTFFHANYSEGVQGKIYKVRVHQRTSAYLVGARQEHDGSTCGTLIFETITPEWMALHFPDNPISTTRPFSDELDRITARHPG